MWLGAAGGRSAISKQAPVPLIAECALLRRSRTAEPTLTAERWFLSVCYRNPKVRGPTGTPREEKGVGWTWTRSEIARSDSSSGSLSSRGRLEEQHRAYAPDFSGIWASTFKR